MKTTYFMKHLNRNWLLSLLCAMCLFTAYDSWAMTPASPDEEEAATDEFSETFNSKKFNKWKNSHNFVTALKFFETDYSEEEDEKSVYLDAISYLDKEIKQHPSNGYAFCNKAFFQRLIAENTFNMWLYNMISGSLNIDMNDNDKVQQEFEKKTKEVDLLYYKAIASLEKGITLLPAKDKDNIYKAYMLKADILNSCNQSDSAQIVAAYNKALDVMPTKEGFIKLLSFYNDHNDNASLYSTIMRMNTVLSIDDDDTLMLLTASSHKYSGDYDKALAIINKILSQDPTNEDALELRADIYMNQGKYSDCVDQIINLSNKGIINDTVDKLIEVCDANEENTDMVFEKVRQAINDDSEEELTNWNIVEGYLYAIKKNDYQKSIECLKKSLNQSNNPAVLGTIAINYYLLGQVENALQMLEEAASIQLAMANSNSDDEEERSLASQDYLGLMLDLESNCGLVDKAINDAQLYRIINGDGPGSITAYYTLDWAYLAKGKYKECLDICDRWIQECPDSYVPLYRKAYALTVMGRTDEAHEILKDILSDESNFENDNELKFNVLLRLGRTDEAIEILDSLAQNTKLVNEMTEQERNNTSVLPEVMSYYNLACSYSLLGDKEKALDYLRKHFEECQDTQDINYDYAILDYDFDNIRQEPEFMQLINEYKQRWLDGKLKMFTK